MNCLSGGYGFASVLRCVGLVYCIVVKENLDRQIMFLGNVEVDEVSVTAEVLFNHLQSYFVEKGVLVDKVIGFGSDDR